MRKQWKKLAIFAFCIMGGVAVWVTCEWYRDSRRVVTGRTLPFWRTPIERESDQWINVFIHGTFGSTAGLLDLNAVRNDEIEGTAYKRLVLMMRNNPIFSLEQPLLPERGLVEIRPTFEITDPANRRAAYPLLKAFDMVNSAVVAPQQQNRYYLFGWSGLLSQRRRRKEAVRLYNALVEERDRLRAQGFNPKIRILAHSHGGSVALNLGGIKEALEGEWSILPSQAVDMRVQRVQSSMLNFLKTLPTQSPELSPNKPYALDYLPNKVLVVDELVMFGTPIQIETAYFARSDLFGTVYNIYSDEDCVQEIDWLSTAEGYSDKRFDGLSLAKSEDATEQSRIVQVKLTISRQVAMPGQRRGRLRWWRVLLGLDDIERKTQDPTHRELWFIVPPDKDEQSILKPVPVAVFTPAIIKLINEHLTLNDVDIDFSINDQRLLLRLFDHGQDKVKATTTVPNALLCSLKERLQTWVPRETDSENGRRVMEAYVQLCKNTPAQQG